MITKINEFRRTLESASADGGTKMPFIDYDMDNDTEVGPDGLEQLVWIEIRGIKPEAFIKLTTNYAEFAKPFDEWAEKHNFYPAEIDTDESEKSMRFTVNCGGKSRKKINAAEEIFESDLLLQPFILELLAGEQNQ